MMLLLLPFWEGEEAAMKWWQRHQTLVVLTAILLMLVFGVWLGNYLGQREREEIEQRLEYEEQLREKLEQGGGVTCDGVALSETGECIPQGEDYWMLCDAPTRAAVVAGKTECVYAGGGS